MCKNIYSRRFCTAPPLPTDLKRLPHVNEAVSNADLRIVPVCTIPMPLQGSSPYTGEAFIAKDISKGSGAQLPNIIGGGTGAEPPCNQYVSPQNSLCYGHVAHGLVCGSAIWLGRQFGTYSHVGPLHRNQRDFWLLLVTKVTYNVSKSSLSLPKAVSEITPFGHF